jgi:hypothetical protein
MIQPDDLHRRRDEEKLQLHHLVAEHLKRDPERVVGIAQTNLASCRERLVPNRTTPSGRRSCGRGHRPRSSL